MSRSSINKGTRDLPDMGCDIHIVVAKREGGKAVILWDSHEFWEAAGERTPEEHAAYWKRMGLLLARNYERFARLSGVRGDGPEPNGWPAWMREHPMYKDETLHSHTHYPIRKAAKIFLATEYSDSDRGQLAKANPISMYFNIDPDEHDLRKVYVFIAYDN